MGKGWWFGQYGPTGKGLAAGVSTLLFLLIVVLPSILIVVGNHSDHVSCLRLHEQTGLATRYARSGASGECYVRVGGQWVPEDRWRQLGDQP